MLIKEAFKTNRFLVFHSMTRKHIPSLQTTLTCAYQLSGMTHRAITLRAVYFMRRGSLT
jgi:hypothetical protein